MSQNINFMENDFLEYFIMYDRSYYSVRLR